MKSLEMMASELAPAPNFPRSLAARYQPDCVVGEGGFGVVYRARQLGLKRTVAVKLVRAHQLAENRIHDSFAREARAMARVAHPAVIPVLDHGIADGVPYIVMPFLSGPSLLDLLEAGPLPWQDVLRHAIRVAHGLHAIHMAGIVHRDLKPSNVLLDETSEAVLTDFGLSKAVGLRSQTHTGILVGTPGYVAPERLDGQPEIPQSDLYSLGVMLWALLVGSRPFQLSSGDPSGTARTPMPEMVAASVQPLPRFPTERVGAPAALVSLIRRLLSINPEARGSHAQQVARELEQIHSAGHQEDETAAMEQPRRSRRRGASHRSRPKYLHLLPVLARHWANPAALIFLGSLLLLALPLIAVGRRPAPLPPIPVVNRPIVRASPKAETSHILDIGVARELAERLARERDLPLFPVRTQGDIRFCPVILTRTVQLADVQLSLRPGLRLLSVNDLEVDPERSTPYHVGLNWLQIAGDTHGQDCGIVNVPAHFKATDIQPVKECIEERMRDHIVVESNVMYDWTETAASKALQLVGKEVRRTRPALVALMRSMIGTYMLAQGSRGPTFDPYISQQWVDPEVLQASAATLDAAGRALEENPSSWEAWHDLGWVLCHRGHIRMGRLALCQSLVYAPDSHWSWWELSQAEAICWQDPARPAAEREHHRREALVCVERARRYLRRQGEGATSSAMASTLDAGYALLSASSDRRPAAIRGKNGVASNVPQ